MLETIDPDAYPPMACACPRCGAAVQQRFAGPCASCIAELRSTLVGAARDVETEYVPKVNVTPNAVALKDD